MGEKVGYAVVKEEHTIKKRILPQNTGFSAEQSAIIEAIQSEKNNRHEIGIIIDSLRRKEDTKAMPSKDQMAISIDSEPGMRGPPPAPPRWKGSAIHYAPSATPIYLSTTYCGNAKKLRTRE
jgi:hypothetical protein